MRLLTPTQPIRQKFELDINFLFNTGKSASKLPWCTVYLGRVAESRSCEFGGQACELVSQCDMVVLLSQCDVVVLFGLNCF
jgi:hypothetical protein